MAGGGRLIDRVRGAQGRLRGPGGTPTGTGGTFPGVVHSRDQVGSPQRAHRSPRLRAGRQHADGGALRPPPSSRSPSGSRPGSLPLNRVERERLVRRSSTRPSASARSSRCSRTTTIGDIMINGPKKVYVERKGGSDHDRTSSSATTSTCSRSSTASSRASAAASTRPSPMVDARLPDGSRVNAIIPPLALDGAVVSIRRSARAAARRTTCSTQGAHARDARRCWQACVQGPAQHHHLGRHRLRARRPC